MRRPFFDRAASVAIFATLAVAAQAAQSTEEQPSALWLAQQSDDPAREDAAPQGPARFAESLRTSRQAADDARAARGLWSSTLNAGPKIGITQRAVDEPLALHLGLEGRNAVLITSILAGMAAERAGVEKYDILLSVDGSEGATVSTLPTILQKKQAGDSITLQLLRRGQPIERTVQLTESASPGGSQSGLPRNPWWSGRDARDPTQLPDALLNQAPLNSALSAYAAAQKSLQSSLAELNLHAESLRADPSSGNQSALSRLTDVRSELERALENLDRAQRSRNTPSSPGASALRPDFPFVTGRDGRDVLVLPPGLNAWPTAPTNPSGLRSQRSDPSVEQRLDRLTERFDRLEALLSKALNGGK